MAIVDERVVDYAEPLIKLEKLLRQIHDNCLEKKYASAGDLSLVAISELRILTATLALMQEKER